MNKPLKISILSILYILGGITLFIVSILLVILHFTGSTLIELLWIIFPDGGFYAGDTVITIAQLYNAMLFLLPMFIITSIISAIGGFLAIKTEKKIAWYLMILSSILYCLIVIGLITDYIFLKEDVKNIYIT
ncbi:MAG: hypothetical protein GF329_09955 [Candidatus Lokiarchaeota archaeon]|nr:hypothetical protein [Candidatus Lokiarchaeota archaeon]